MRKKVFYIIVAAVVVLCFIRVIMTGITVADDGEGITLTLYHWDNGGRTETSLVEDVCKEFERQNSGITVKVEIISSYENQMQGILASRNVPDVFLVPDGNFGQWVTTGALMELTEYVEDSMVVDLDEVWPSVVSRYRYNGSTMGSGALYCMPKDVTPYVMYYNKDLFDEYNVPYPDPEVPWTPYEVIDYLSMFGSLDSRGNVKSDHVYGLAKFYPESFIWSNGADYLSADRTEVLIDSPEFIEVFDFIQTATMDYHIVPTSTVLKSTSEKTLFLNGKAACYIEGRSVTADLRNTADFEWDIAPGPAFEVDANCNGWSGSVGYAVYKNTPYPDEAYRLAEFFTSKEGQLIMTASGFSIPLYNDEETLEALYRYEKDKYPANTAEYLRAAQYQRAGLWQYLPSVRWKTAFDVDSGAMFTDDPSTRLTAEQFMTDEKAVIEAIIRTDFPWLFTAKQVDVDISRFNRYYGGGYGEKTF